MKFCFGLLGVLELLGVIGRYWELIDGFLSSIEKVNYMLLKKRLQIEFKEVIYLSRLFLRQKMFLVLQKL